MEIFTYIIMVLSWFGAVGGWLVLITDVVGVPDYDEPELGGGTAGTLFIIAMISTVYLFTYYKFIVPW